MSAPVLGSADDDAELDNLGASSPSGASRSGSFSACHCVGVLHGELEQGASSVVWHDEKKCAEWRLACAPVRWSCINSKLFPPQFLEGLSRKHD